MNSLNVFDYQDPIDYLRQVKERYPGRKGGISFDLWSKRLGYRSPRAIAMVINGARLPSPEMVQSLSKDLGHTDREAMYFQLLVLKKRTARKGRVADGIDMDLKRLNPKRASHRKILKEAAFQFIAHWHHYVIHQLAQAPGFIEDAAWIRERLGRKVTELQIERSIELMRTIGLLTRNPQNDKLVDSSNKSFMTTHDVPSSAIREHQRQMLARAAEALEQIPVELREFGSLSLRMKPRKIPEAKKALREFRDWFDARFHDDSARDVFQLNLNFFGHTYRGDAIKRKEPGK